MSAFEQTILRATIGSKDLQDNEKDSGLNSTDRPITFLYSNTTPKIMLFFSIHVASYVMYEQM